uniref:Putative tick salivary peptide group 1 n=1 Tax=Ixodes ricinus TaxID=34613 RepID=V5I3R3_IXORI
MWFTGITLLLVSLAFSGSVANEECENGKRPASQKDREGCDYYCRDEESDSWIQYFFGDGEKCFSEGSGGGDLPSSGYFSPVTDYGVFLRGRSKFLQLAMYTAF